MPKIKPETKVLTIKNLKSKSPAEVACVNVSKRHVERIRYWRETATSMTDSGRADRARQLLETTGCWSASQLQEEWTPVFSQELYVGFLLATVSMVILLPRNQR